MDWERIGIAAGRFFLRLIEYCFKACALLAAGIVMVAPGGFSQKIGAGFSNLSGVLRQLAELPSEIRSMAVLIKDYNTLPPSTFNEMYTAGIEPVMAYLNNINIYFELLGQSLSSRPLATLGAALVLFASFYLLAWVIRFYRQKGQGSWKTQMEREFGDKIFKLSPKPLPNAPMEATQNTVPVKQEKSRSFSAKKVFKRKNSSQSSAPSDIATKKTISQSAPSESAGGSSIGDALSRPTIPPRPKVNEPAWLTKHRTSHKARRNAQKPEVEAEAKAKANANSNGTDSTLTDEAAAASNSKNKTAKQTEPGAGNTVRDSSKKDAPDQSKPKESSASSPAKPAAPKSKPESKVITSQNPPFKPVPKPDAGKKKEVSEEPDPEDLRFMLSANSG